MTNDTDASRDGSVEVLAERIVKVLDEECGIIGPESHAGDVAYAISPLLQADREQREQEGQHDFSHWQRRAGQAEADLAAAREEIERLVELLKTTRDAKLVDAVADAKSWEEQTEMAREIALAARKEAQDALARALRLQDALVLIAGATTPPGKVYAQAINSTARAALEFLAAPQAPTAERDVTGLWICDVCDEPHQPPHVPEPAPTAEPPRWPEKEPHVFIPRDTNAPFGDLCGLLISGWYACSEPATHPIHAPAPTVSEGTPRCPRCNRSMCRDTSAKAQTPGAAVWQCASCPTSLEVSPPAPPKSDDGTPRETHAFDAPGGPAKGTNLYLCRRIAGRGFCFKPEWDPIHASAPPKPDEGPEPPMTKKREPLSCPSENVGCENGEGRLIVHAESATCEICQPPAPSEHK